MIQVVIEMDEQTGQLQIKCAAPPLVAFAVVTNAYHELLAMKIRSDLKGESRVVEAGPAAMHAIAKKIVH